VGLGEKFDEHALRDLPAGSYGMLPRRLPHYNRIRGETVLQFHGTGPYDINYVNPADDPRQKANWPLNHAAFGPAGVLSDQRFLSAAAENPAPPARL
jgi:hypothetical protein